LSDFGQGYWIRSVDFVLAWITKEFNELRAILGKLYVLFFKVPFEAYPNPREKKIAQTKFFFTHANSENQYKTHIYSRVWVTSEHTLRVQSDFSRIRLNGLWESRTRTEFNKDFLRDGFKKLDFYGMSPIL
jgi:hypothetical protein